MGGPISTSYAGECSIALLDCTTAFGPDPRQIEHIQGPKPTTVDQDILHEIHRPGFSRSRDCAHCFPRCDRHPLAFAPAQVEPFQPIEPIDPLMIDHARARVGPARAAADSPSADAVPPRCASARGSAAHQDGLALIAHGGPMRADQAAGTPLGELIGRLQVAHGPSAGRGRYQFFAVISLSA